MLQRMAWLLGLVAAVHGLPAAALGLGAIEVDSHLNQPFSAVITLYSVSAEETGSLQVQLAPADEFQKAGIQRSSYLSSLRFAVSGGRVKVSSDQIVKEPFLNLLVEARADGNRVLRSYSILFDPPAADAAVPAAETAEETARRDAASAPVNPGSTPAAAVPAVARPAPPAATLAKPASANPVVIGPVRPGQTFWNIGVQLRPSDSVSMDQTMLAIYEANPESFSGGFNGLIIGSKLRVPTEEQMRSVSPEEAHRRVQILRNPPTAAAPKVAAVPTTPAAKAAPVPKPAPVKPVPAPIPEPKPKAEAKVEAKPEAKPEPAPAAAALSERSKPAVVEPRQATAPADAPTSAPPPAPVVERPVATAASEPAAQTNQSADSAGAVAVDDPAAMAEPAPVEAGNPLDGFLPYLLAAGLFLVLLLIAVTLRRRRQQAVFRNDSLEDYLRPPPPLGNSDVSSRLPIAPLMAAPVSEPSLLPPLRGTPLLTARRAETFFEPDPAVVAVKMAPSLGLPPIAAPEDELDDASDLADVAAPVEEPVSTPRDALAEADFNLSYGHYESAIRGLRSAQAQDPDRLDLAVKLAETYFAAGRPADFENLAEDLEARVDARQWEDLAAMGSQLCPDSVLFKAPSIPDPEPMDHAEEVLVEPDVELSPEPFAEPEPEPEPEPELDLPVEPQIEPVLQLPDHPPVEPSPVLPVEPEIEPEIEPEPEPDRPIEAMRPVQPSLDFDQRAEPVHGARSEPRSTPTIGLVPEGFAVSRGQGLNIRMAPAADPMPKPEPPPTGPEALVPAPANPGDARIKLDLARAYMEMGDSKMARGLLQEVSAQGSPAQQADARALLARIPG